MNNHPVINIFLNKYQGLYKNLPNKTHIILLPESQTLLNVNINLEFIKRHLFYKGPSKDIYINLLDECIEIDSKNIYTSYGFEENKICEIIKIETNANYKFFKVIFINVPLNVQDNEENNFFSYYDIGENKERVNHFYNDSNNYKNDLNIFFNTNIKCKEFFYSQLNEFKHTYIIVKGYENFIGKKILNIVDDTLTYQNNTNQKLNDKDIKISLIKFTYASLYKHIWKNLLKNYENIEYKIQHKMAYLRKDISAFLKKVQLENISFFHIKVISFHIKQIEKYRDPINKIHILDNISKIICEVVSAENNNLKEQNIAIYDINSDTLISVLVAAISFGEIQNLISHSLHLHMYIDNLSTSEKIDKLSYIFTIFHSAIMYLCDVKNI
ncbi:hypothetical protein PFAG_03507 [Plasmodium falciparum Santa Lucia]|uniref:VPS9 domain-containing protein, putative n=14 Tax=Plasmodium falciparum TaxID=5833 RepID=Q8IHX3_PLAF7|nr:VPS9 domain-containing protein, putative [Plasmodium falciparum 3D7]ETW15295.1 hypothetical protein PFFVO_05589 [Plasmodium falciparum Vietnam Oak-Knoll (FVO)]ETW30304.1 hypothetical protein PFFCH_02263 [Plasmodium falciparum FCH/4]ETW35774.1 hypothetical protein PFTANZ_03523 [Plasmodium falciparum Tanzania (2000708)]ETW42175.1 hypothetical protein PFNF135_03673 [Plasmodium falciparum NF135/5.C10]ETW48485.1 hypothetical protein PFMALIP_03459 [Plasmodium falciparum MaliPS096_E11]ETW54996.1 |eukprot:XP_001348073.1 conserved Plasmodium protein, unknown function [Plasmodium falciparum 3D7]